ncbi:heavy metal-associated isoprenylated plant protein 46-like [Tripterygium wilfordii]|uniref:heavy metal-associated isoprenylated plant protein 46-like n=1 Tax=Tripterygium wilfordii TaxID=458696 RepID=UPI0018F8565A|nr:heavy metal-associated isoprenylated plant protein 46-like [Tripterygium wilfordii]
MKQKIVIRVSMDGQKCRSQWCQSLMSAAGFSEPNPRSKTLKTVVSLQGVERAALGGSEKDEIEVTGDGIDAVKLTDLLRKKVGFAELVSVTPVEEKKKDEPAVVPMFWSYGVPQYKVYEIKGNNYSPCGWSIW